MAVTFLVVWFVSGILGLHIAFAMGEANGEKAEPFFAWWILMGVFMLVGALWVAVETATKARQ